MSWIIRQNNYFMHHQQVYRERVINSQIKIEIPNLFLNLYNIKLFDRTIAFAFKSAKVIMNFPFNEYIPVDYFEMKRISTYSRFTIIVENFIASINSLEEFENILVKKKKETKKEEKEKTLKDLTTINKSSIINNKNLTRKKSEINIPPVMIEPNSTRHFGKIPIFGPEKMSDEESELKLDLKISLCAIDIIDSPDTHLIETTCNSLKFGFDDSQNADRFPLMVLPIMELNYDLIKNIIRVNIPSKDIDRKRIYYKDDILAINNLYNQSNPSNSSINEKKCNLQRFLHESKSFTLFVNYDYLEASTKIFENFLDRWKMTLKKYFKTEENNNTQNIDDKKLQKENKLNDDNESKNFGINKFINANQEVKSYNNYDLNNFNINNFNRTNNSMHSLVNNTLNIAVNRDIGKNSNLVNNSVYSNQIVQQVNKLGSYNNGIYSNKFPNNKYLANENEFSSDYNYRKANDMVQRTPIDYDMLNNTSNIINNMNLSNFNNIELNQYNSLKMNYAKDSNHLPLNNRFFSQNYMNNIQSNDNLHNLSSKDLKSQKNQSNVFNQNKNQVNYNINSVYNNTNVDDKISALYNNQKIVNNNNNGNLSTQIVVNNNYFNNLNSVHQNSNSLQKKNFNLISINADDKKLTENKQNNYLKLKYGNNIPKYKIHNNKKEETTKTEDEYNMQLFVALFDLKIIYHINYKKDNKEFESIFRLDNATKERGYFGYIIRIHSSSLSFKKTLDTENEEGKDELKVKMNLFSMSYLDQDKMNDDLYFNWDEDISKYFKSSVEIQNILNSRLNNQNNNTNSKSLVPKTFSSNVNYNLNYNMSNNNTEENLKNLYNYNFTNTNTPNFNNNQGEDEFYKNIKIESEFLKFMELKKSNKCKYMNNITFDYFDIKRKDNSSTKANNKYRNLSVESRNVIIKIINTNFKRISMKKSEDMLIKVNRFEILYNKYNKDLIQLIAFEDVLKIVDKIILKIDIEKENDSIEFDENKLNLNDKPNKSILIKKASICQNDEAMQIKKRKKKKVKENNIANKNFLNTGLVKFYFSLKNPKIRIENEMKGSHIILVSEEECSVELSDICLDSAKKDFILNINLKKMNLLSFTKSDKNTNKIVESPEINFYIKNTLESKIDKIETFNQVSINVAKIRGFFQAKDFQDFYNILEILIYDRTESFAVEKKKLDDKNSILKSGKKITEIKSLIERKAAYEPVIQDDKILKRIDFNVNEVDLALKEVIFIIKKQLF